MARQVYDKYSFFLIRNRFWRKFVCSYMYPHWLWPLVIGDKDYDRLLNEPENIERPPLATRLLQRIIWFWPRLRDAARWAKSEECGTVSPLHFAELEPKSLVLINEVITQCPTRNAPLLELGCNCGRYLNAFVERGYTDLSGVDISAVGLAYMDVRFPELKSRVRVRHDCFQRFLNTSKNEQFEVTYTHGATIELVHPSFPIVREIARVTKSAVVLLIQENGQAYPRLWEAEFERHGFGLFKVLRPAVADELGHDLSSLLVFRKLPAQP